MPTTTSHRLKQMPNQIVDVASWKGDDENPIFPVGSKPKRLLRCPSDPAEPFLIGGHRYLYKSAHGWRSQQSWSEVIAYELARDLGVQVPAAFIAIDSSDGTMGVLIEFFYGYPDDPTPPHFLHATDLLQRMRRGKSFDPTIDRPHSVQMNIRICSALGTAFSADWWAKTMTFDALIGNTDRHPQNWGFLVSRIEPERVEMKVAPVFDNGTSLGYEHPDAKLAQRWQQDKLLSYIKRGHHHCSWEPQSLTGDSHIELCNSVAQHSAEASLASQSVIRLDDAKVDEITAWCTEFEAPIRFSDDRAYFVAQQLKARRDALAEAVGG